MCHSTVYPYHANFVEPSSSSRLVSEHECSRSIPFFRSTRNNQCQPCLFPMEPSPSLKWTLRYFRTTPGGSNTRINESNVEEEDFLHKNFKLHKYDPHDISKGRGQEVFHQCPVSLLKSFFNLRLP